MAPEIASLGSDETQLVGRWVAVRGGAEGDATTKRIESLVRDRLIEVGVADGGWAALYRDPSDGRLWELSFPQSEGHGGGAPSLVVIRASEAAQRYRAVVPSNTSLERTRER